MACSNCKCEDAQPTRATDVDPVAKLEESMKTLAYISERIRDQVADINKFLYDKYPTDLTDGAGTRVTCSYYTYHQKLREENSLALQRTIEDLQAQGYIVAKPEAPTEPTLEASIRDVVLANTPVK